MTVPRRKLVALPPTVSVSLTYAPEPGARESLVDLLVELLEARRHSRRGSK